VDKDPDRTVAAEPQRQSGVISSLQSRRIGTASFARRLVSDVHLFGVRLDTRLRCLRPGRHDRTGFASCHRSFVTAPHAEMRGDRSHGAEVGAGCRQPCDEMPKWIREMNRRPPNGTAPGPIVVAMPAARRSFRTNRIKPAQTSPLQQSPGAPGRGPSRPAAGPTEWVKAIPTGARRRNLRRPHPEHGGTEPRRKTRPGRPPRRRHRAHALRRSASVDDRSRSRP